MADTNDTKPDAPATDDSDTDKNLAPAGKKALDAEREARRDAERRANEAEARLREIADADKSEVDRLKDENARLTAELASSTSERSRFSVALTKGLTASQARRLVGSTEDELLADADELLADLGAKPDDERPPPPGGKPAEALKPGSGDPDTAAEVIDVKSLGQRMFAN